MKFLNRESLRNLFLAGLFLVFITVGLRAIAPGAPSAPDYQAGSPGSEVVVEIPTGATGSTIAQILLQNDVIKSELAFFRVAVSDRRSARIAPGEHRLERKIPAKIALEQLLDPERIVNLVKVRDGAWLGEIVSSLEAVGFKRVNIAKALAERRPPTAFATKSLEGFLYPAFYSPVKGATAGDVIDQMLARFVSDTSEIKWMYGKYTPLQLLTVASIVESEGTPDVHGKVARVIYNRLAKGMPLQMDSTVHYVFKRRGEIQLSIKDTKVKNPYNTFVNTGLPPGPIGSPTIASIKAALAPDPGPWLYFVTVEPKVTKFTDSYEEFLTFKAEYKENLARGLFK